MAWWPPAWLGVIDRTRRTEVLVLLYAWQLINCHQFTCTRAEMVKPRAPRRMTRNASLVARVARKEKSRKEKEREREEEKETTNIKEEGLQGFNET